MSERLQQFGLTPGRGVLVAALAVAMGLVWGPQIASLWGPSSPPPAVSLASRTRPGAAPAVRSGENAAEVKTDERAIPAYTVETASAYDPFTLPPWVPRASDIAANGPLPPGAPAMQFETLRSKGVAMILVSDGDAAAQVGDRTLHIGDRIDGFEVVKITAGGVEFRPADGSTTGDARGR